MTEEAPPSTPRGILTPKQREYLATPEEDRTDEFTRQQRYRWNTQIRDRVTNAMYDFARLRAGLTDEELEEIFGGPTVHELGENEDLDDYEADQVPLAAAPQVIAFLARAHDLDGAQFFPNRGREQRALADLFRTFDKGIETWLASEKSMLAGVRTDVQIADPRPVPELVEEAEEGGAVDPGVSMLRSQALLAAAARNDDERETLLEAYTDFLEQSDEYDVPSGVLEQLTAAALQERDGDDGGE